MIGGPRGYRLAVPPSLLSHALDLATMTAAAQYTHCPSLPSVLDVARYTRNGGAELLTPADVIVRRAGDCAALSCALAGELRARGIDRSARAIAYEVPGGRHVVVATSWGIIDPSRECARRNGVLS